MAAGGDATPKKPTGKKRGPKPGSKRTPKAAAAAAGPGASASAAAQQPAGSKAVMLQFVQRGREQQQQQQQPPQRGGGISLVRGTSVRSTTAATAAASGSKENVVVLSDDDDSGGGVVELQPRQQQRKAQPPPPPRVVSAVAAAAAVDPIMSCSTSRSSPPVVPTPVDITPPAPYVVPSPSEASVVSPTPLLSPFVSVHSLQQTTACADSLMSQSAVVGNTQTPSPSPFASLSETLASAAAAAAASVKPTPPRSQVLPAFRRLREPAAASAPASAAAAAAAAAATSAAAVATPIAARRSATPLSSAAAVAAGANTPPSKKVRRAEKVEAAAQAVAPPVVPPCSTVGAAAEPAAAAAATEVAAAAAREAWAIAAACASAVASAVACAAAAAVAAAAEASSPRAATSLTPPPPPRAAHADDAAVLRRVLAPSPDLRVLALTVCDGATRHEGVRVETGGRSHVGTGIDFRVEPPPAEAAVDGGGAAAAAAAAAVAEEVLEVRVVFCEGWLAGDGGVAAVAAGARWNLVAHDGPFDVGVSVDASAAAGGRRCFVLRNATRVLAVACPETGVSATEVSDALQCQRKAWLSRRCRGGRSESAPAALAGIVVHGVLQDALGGGAPRAGISEHEVRGLIERHVAQVSLSFYFAGITDEGARAEVYPFVPSIMHCVSAMSASAATEDAFGRVLPDRPLRNTRVVHAEKAVSCPHHGLRGIVDAEAVTDPGVPLAIELKSLQHLPQRGRPVMKVHHKAQLMVYLLLLKHGGGPVRSGLLAYLPKGSATCRLVGVEREHLWNELHHIVKVRNALAVALATDAVPAPYYQQVSACRYCNSREACLSLASVDGATPPPADTKQFLRKVAPGMVAPPLPDIEDAAGGGGGGGGASSACDDTLRRTGLRQTSAYALPAQMPQAHSAGGRSYGGGSSGGGGTAATTAMGEDDDGDDDEGAVAGASWLALPRTPAQRSYLSNWLRWLSLEGAKEARLRARPTAGRSSLETGSSETLLAKHRGAVAALYAGHRHGRLRRLVADLEEPRLSSQPEAVGRLEDIMGCATRPVGLPELNCEQHAAVRHVLCSDDYAVIQGLPGTGKTSTLAVLVYFLSVVLGQRVLVVAGTNSAVDTLCLRLLGIEHMRFHRLLSISLQRDPDSWDAPPALRERVLADVASLGSVAEARAAVEAVRVVCTTAHNLHHAALGQGREGVGLEFDCVVVDEAAQMMQPLVLAALFFAPKFVLVGDHEQLPPVLKSRTAAEEGASVSLLERLASAHPYSVATLSTQYRMNSQIADLANLITYGGRLKTVCPLVSARRLTPLTPAGLAGASVDRLPEWLRACVSADPAVVFVDTTDVQRPRTDAEPPNACGVEAEMARRIAGYVLARCGCQTAAVISPFRNQVDRITQEGHLRGVAGASVYTVDQAQGRDVDVVVVTLAKHVGDQVGDLIRSPRRINVAFTRAKRKQVCLGAFGGVFDGVEEWAPLLAWARAEKVLFRPQSLL
eukprot:Rhum_TRINITY_DN12681_c0_g1::Rhum_TRINITY_DN12681_c0_g1_i1::g.53170::m.53170/K10742/DNA2; DNA replication ATP-dependent helicase Dna2